MDPAQLASQEADRLRASAANSVDAQEAAGHRLQGTVALMVHLCLAVKSLTTRPSSVSDQDSQQLPLAVTPRQGLRELIPLRHRCTTKPHG